MLGKVTFDDHVIASKRYWKGNISDTLTKPFFFFFFFKFLYFTRHKISNTVLVCVLHLDSIEMPMVVDIRTYEIHFVRIIIFVQSHHIQSHNNYKEFLYR